MDILKSSTFWLKRVLPVLLVFLVILTVVFWGSADAPQQSPSRPFGLQPVSLVQRAGSDWASKWFLIRWLPRMLYMADARLKDGAAQARFSELVLDPTRLRLTETTDVRIYFIGADSGKQNSLGINLAGVGIDEGRPKLIFPYARDGLSLHRTAKIVNRIKGLFAFPVVFAPRLLINDTDKPLLPGDFVDLGTIEAGTTLEFFLLGNGALNEGKDADPKEIFTAHQEKNVDKIPHMVAVALKGSPYLLLSFEDLFEGGDRDYSDCVFAVRMSDYNIEALLEDIDPWYRLKQMLKLIVTLFIFVGIPVGIVLSRFLLRWWRLRKAKKHTEELWSSGAIQDALAMIDYVKKKYCGQRLRGDWKRLAFDIYEGIHDSAGLEALLDASGNKDFLNREKASLLASRSLLVNERIDALGELREHWRGREQHVPAWKEMDARLLNQQGRYQEVEQQFGADLTYTADEAGLIAQVAEAVRHRDTREASQALSAAAEKAPNNPEVWLGLGKIHEQANALNKAEQAYQQALKLSQRNPFVIHKVGEFYRRQARYESALKIWSRALAHPSLHVLWTQCLFWRKVATAYPINWTGLPPPEGYLLPVIQVLGQLDENEFWNTAATQCITTTSPGLLERQEIFWLRLLDAFLSDQEAHALMLLNTQMFSENSWNPLLELALLRVLTYRRNGFITPIDCSMNMESNPLKSSKLFNALVQWSLGFFQEEPTSLITLIQSDEIIVRLFADAGWTRAAGILAGKSE